MGKLAAREEVLYHIGISAAQIQGARYALLPGDPGRVEALAKGLGPATFVGAHREYTSWLADLEGTPILVISTGMGGPSVSIGMEELARLGITDFIRVGTTGSIQPHIALGEVVINKAAVRLDGASYHYAPATFPAVASLELTCALVEAAKLEAVPYHVGIAVSSDTFWPGQERYDSFSGFVPQHLQGTLREWQALGATNYEMESATLFVVAQALGLRAAALCGVVAQRTNSEQVAPPAVYQLAAERFATVARRALLLLTKAGN
ncbi:MAG: uridine phosphorylase [Acidaminococcaceae bacterium]